MAAAAAYQTAAARAAATADYTADARAAAATDHTAAAIAAAAAYHTAAARAAAAADHTTATAAEPQRSCLRRLITSSLLKRFPFITNKLHSTVYHIMQETAKCDILFCIVRKHAKFCLAKGRTWKYP
jgi:hypothetical protein